MYSPKKTSITSDVLHQKQVGRDLWHVAPRETNYDDPPFRSGAPQRLHEEFAAHRVEHNVDVPLAVERLVRLPRSAAQCTMP
jgi:hypothetical protein